MVDSLPEADRTPATAGDSESAGGRSAWSREGMASTSNDIGSFAPRCLSLDLEVGVRDRRIHAFAALRPDTGGRLVYRSGDGAAALAKLDALGQPMQRAIVEAAMSGVRRRRGLLLLTAHRAKGLEFDHVAVLDGGWDRFGKGEDPDAPRGLSGKAPLRASPTLTHLRSVRRFHTLFLVRSNSLMSNIELFSNHSRR